MTKTIESVSAGHPDKVADQISDLVLDAFLSHEPKARVACETLIGENFVVLSGETNLPWQDLNIDLDAMIRNKIKSIGYVSEEAGFDVENAKIYIHLHQQSQDIAQGVDTNDGAGDQGIVFGFAIDETVQKMPLGYVLANQLLQRVDSLRQGGHYPFLLPDAKSQITMLLDEAGKPISISNVVISVQHKDVISEEEFREFIMDKVLSILPSDMTVSTRYLINPTGKFVLGGPIADTGLTGRKLLVDSYGAYSRHGGGAFSGKDATKLDRSGAYMARYIAKHVVEAKLAKMCEVSLVYAIGKKEPLAVEVETFGTGIRSNRELAEMVKKHFPLEPKQIAESLKLFQPIYSPTATYGHFGKSGFSWETLDRIEEIKQYV